MEEMCGIDGKVYKVIVVIQERRGHVGELGERKRVKLRCTEVARVDIGHYRKYRRLYSVQKPVLASTAIRLRSEYQQS
jgi:hypothetical protein